MLWKRNTIIHGHNITSTIGEGMNVFTKSEIELMYEAILKVDAITPVFPSPEEATINLSKIWDVTFNESENKKVSGQIAEKELVYAKLTAYRYYLFSLVIPRERGGYYPLLSSLFSQISNTIIAVIKLADEGFDFQALSLTRNLMELLMTLLTVIESPHKRKELRTAVDAESARRVWHKYFNKKHFIQMLKAYTSHNFFLSEACEKWANETYAELSSFAHNDYVNTICFSYAIGENGINPPNLWGEYVSRRKYIYESLVRALGPADTLLISMLRDPKIDVNIRDLFDNFSQEKSFEISAMQNLISDTCISIMADILDIPEIEKMIRKPLCDFDRPKRTLKHYILALGLKKKGAISN